MSRHWSRGWLGVAIVVLFGGVESYGAVPAAESLLPGTTKGFLSVASMDQLQESWSKTQLGQLIADPAMQPFVEDFLRQIQQKWTQTHQKLGITWDDLDGVPAGEVSVAMILSSATEVSLAVTVDVTGHQEQVAALLDKINKNMATKKAVQTTRNVLGTTVTVFDIPKHEETPGSTGGLLRQGRLAGRLR